MSRQLTASTSLDTLRKEAKRWLKALRAQDPDARRRLVHAWPDAPPDPTLRDVQYALAREYGLAGWLPLKNAVADLQRGGSPREQAIHALLRAAEQGDVTRVAELLDAQPDIVNERGRLEGHSGLRTALHFGVGHEPVVRTLLQRGADPNIRDEGDNAFPLHFAAERGDLPVVRLLIEHGAEANAGEVDDHELDIIGWATCFPGVQTNEPLVEYLLAHGARHTLFSAVATGDVDALRARAQERPSDLERPMDKVNRRRHPLHLAVVKNQPAALAALLALGADPDAVDAAGMTPLDEAAIRGANGMAQLLIDAGGQLTLASAIALRRTADVERLLRDDPHALEPGGRWGTLIVQAAADAPADVLETLIKLGASVDVHDAPVTAVDETRGYTALHAAAFHGKLDAIEVLLAHRANPKVRDSRYGGTPAGWASYAGKHEAFERLIAADLDIFDAIDFDRPDRIPDILRHDPRALHRPFGEYLPAGATPPAWCPDPGMTPLAWATRENKVEAARRLASEGAELADGGHQSRTHPERVASFLRMACLDWRVGGSDRARHSHAATRLLKLHPEIARENIYTAIACGEIEEVERLLAERPAAAAEPGGPRNWPPLLYLCSTRLSEPGAWSDHAVALARALLDRGADPNVYHPGGDPSIHYTALACIAGRGEEQAAVHPRARELAALLLERGAEPYDVQLLYNVFAGHASHPLLNDDDFVWWLDLMRRESLKRGRSADWNDPTWQMFEVGGYGGGAWYLLHNALKGNYLRIAEWALSHGADPNPPRASDPRTPSGTLYEQAVRTGRLEFAELLARYGAPRSAPQDGVDPPSRFAAACLRLDRQAAQAITADHPEVLLDPGLLHDAAERDDVEVARLLLDLGMSPDIPTGDRATPVHCTRQRTPARRESPRSWSSAAPPSIRGTTCTAQRRSTGRCSGNATGSWT